jgi:hypothetical protein
VLLLAVPLALAPPAHADPIVDGCYGVAVVVCDPTVSAPVGVNTTEVPVCAGTCTYVAVPVPDVGSVNDDVCATWTDDRGGPGGTCVNLGDDARAALCYLANKGCPPQN